MYCDEDEDGHLETLLLKSPIKEQRDSFHLYDISKNGEVSLASPEKHRQVAEMFGLMTEFWQEKAPQINSYKDFKKETNILNEKIEQSADDTANPSPASNSEVP